MKPRRGVTMLELLAATVVVAALMTAIAELVVLSTGQHAEMERRMVALSEAQRIIEQVSAMPFAEVDEQSLRRLQLSANSAKALRGAEVTTSIADETVPPAGKRVVVEITWESHTGAPTRPVRLTTWRFAAGGAQ